MFCVLPFFRSGDAESASSRWWSLGGSFSLFLLLSQGSTGMDKGGVTNIGSGAGQESGCRFHPDRRSLRASSFSWSCGPDPRQGDNHGCQNFVSGTTSGGGVGSQIPDPEPGHRVDWQRFNGGWPNVGRSYRRDR